MTRVRLALLALGLAFLLCACNGAAEAGENSGVQTDWSQLGERATVEPIYSRWYENYTNELIPLEGGYGTLLPYAGVRLMDDWPASTGFLYGLVTPEGVIVTDPVFSSVERVTIAGEPLLLLQGSTVLQVEGEEYGYYCNWYIAAPDGQWVTGPLSGNLIQGEDALLVVGPEGFAHVSHQGETAHYSWEDLGYEQDKRFWWMNRADTTITSDYIVASCSCQGDEANGWHYYDLHTNQLKKVHLEPGIRPGGDERAFFQDGLTLGWTWEGQGSGFLNLEGEWVLGPRVDLDGYISEGYIIAYDQNGGGRVYDATGKLCLESYYRLGHYTWENGAFFVEEFFQEDEEGGYMERGQIYDESFNRSPLSDQAGTMCRGGWFWDWNLKNELIRGDERIPLPDELSGLGRYVDIFPEEDFISVWIMNQEHMQTEHWILSWDGTLLYRAPEGVEIIYLTDDFAGGTYLYYDTIENEQRLRHLLTLAGEALRSLPVDGWGESIRVMNGMIYEENDEKSAFYSPNGECLFQYPMRGLAEE